MAESLTKYAQIALIGSFDLVSGETIATIMSAIFPKSPVIPLNISNNAFFNLCFSIFLQGVMTLWVAEEVREFFLSGTTDPTGGILLILSLFRQPNFWDKVDVAVTVITDKIMGLVQNKNGDTSDEQ